jgi:hypothetical protein
MDYKKYSLENLENWMHDAISCSEATPQEIYDVIKRVVDENYHIYKNHTERCYELLALLNGNGKGHIPAYDEYVEKKENLVCDKDDKSPECQQSWNDFWEENYYPKEHQKHNKKVKDDCMPPWGHSDMEALQYTEEELNAMCDSAESGDKVVKWQLPVEVDGISGEYYIQFPDDLMEAVGIKEDDLVEWIDRKDGSFELRKVTKLIGMEEC